MVIWQQGRKVPLAWSLSLLYTLGTNNSCSMLTLPKHRHSLPEDPNSAPTPRTTPITQNAKFFQNQTYDHILEPNLSQIPHCKSEFLVVSVTISMWHLVRNIIRYDMTELNSTCLRLSDSTLEPVQAVRSLCTEDLVGCHGYKCQQGYACPGIFQSLSSLIRAAWTTEENRCTCQ